MTEVKGGSGVSTPGLKLNCFFCNKPIEPGEGQIRQQTYHRDCLKLVDEYEKKLKVLK